MLSPQERWTLSNLIGQEIAGQASDADHDRLQTLLLESAEARAYYYRSIAVHADLFWTSGVPATEEPSAPVDLSVELAGPARITKPRKAVRLSSRLMATGATLLLVGYFVGAAVYVMLRNTPSPVAKSPAVATPANDVAADAAAARVVASDGGQPDAIPEMTVGPVAARRPLSIDTGVVELELKQGVTLRVEAPAEWTIDGPNRATLKYGKLLATVPHEAIGFTVTTPTATVVDLGTEFGVTVDERGDTRTRVFRGEVKLHAASSEDTSSATSVATPKVVSHRLTAGQAVRIDATGNITPVEPEFATAEEFIRRPGTPAQTSDPENAFSQAVLATAGLVGYWRLAEAGPGEACDALPITEAERAATARRKNFPMRPISAGRSPGGYREFWMADFRRPGALPGEKNCAVHFNGESYVEVEDHSSLSGDWDGLTLAAWIKPDRNPPAGSDATALIVGKWAFEASGDAYVLLYERPGTIRLAVGNGKQDENGLRGTGTVPITADAYHFVAGTWDKATGAYRLYVDGQADAAQGRQQAPWQTNPKSYVPVFIGGQRATNNRYFAGTIDEVCIFNRTLTAEEIKNLYEQATPKSQPGETPAVNPIDQR